MARFSLPYLLTSLLAVTFAAFSVALPAKAQTIYASCFDPANSSGPRPFGTVNVQTGAFTAIGSTTDTIFSMAFAPNGSLYAVMSGNLYSINTSSAALTLIGTPSQFLIGLASAPDGTLYGRTSESPGGRIYQVNTSTAALTALPQPFADVAIPRHASRSTP
jgi:hypothetical protein